MNPLTIRTCDFCNYAALTQRIAYTGTSLFILVPEKPVTDKHFLIIPKTHRSSFGDLSSPELTELRELVLLLRNRLQSDGYNLLSNNGSAEFGQHIGHFHQHVFLREAEDTSPFDVLNGTIERPHYEPIQLVKHCAQLRRKLAQK